MTRQSMSASLKTVLSSKAPGQMFLITASPSTGDEYYTTHGSIIVSGGHSFLPLAGAIQGFSFGSNGLNSVSIGVSNVDNKLTDWQIAGELRGMAVSIAVGNLDAPDDVAVLMDGRITRCPLTKSGGTIEILSTDAYYSRKNGRIMSEICWKWYGSPECGRTPDATYPTCPYTPEGCAERGNSANLGALPPLKWSKT